VYCKDINRTATNPDIQFTVLGYTFRPRKAVDKYGRVYVNFSPAVSRDALKAMRQTIRGWRSRILIPSPIPADWKNRLVIGSIKRAWLASRFSSTSECPRTSSRGVLNLVSNRRLKPTSAGSRLCRG